MTPEAAALDPRAEDTTVLDDEPPHGDRMSDA